MNKRFLSALSALFLSALLCLVSVTAEAAPPIRAFFSPGSECATALISEVDQARESVKVMIFRITDPEIAAAFVRAHQRGVKVSIIMDMTMRERKHSQLGTLLASGVPVAIDEQHHLMHNKVVIIDGQEVITGSYNFTTLARDNGENMVILSDKSIAEQFSENFSHHLAHSTQP